MRTAQLMGTIVLSLGTFRSQVWFSEVSMR